MNVLILGLGWTGMEILKKTVCDAQFLGDDYTFSVTAIDNDFRENHGRYKYLIDDAAEAICGSVTINPNYEGKSVYTANSERFYDWLNVGSNILNFDRIIVALGDDELNINTALQITKFRMQHQSPGESFEKIFAHVRDFEKYKYYKDKESLIMVFGELKRTNSCDVMINESLNRAGMLINYVYSQYETPLLKQKEFDAAVRTWKETIEKEWLTASEFDHDSSIAVAMNILNVIRMAGGVAQLNERMEDEDYVEKLSEMEHKRWSAFHFVNGVHRWDMANVTTTNGKLKFDNILARHICLVPYEDLDKASAHVNSLRRKSGSKSVEDYKESDRRIVRHYPYIIETEGMEKIYAEEMARDC